MRIDTWRNYIHLCAYLFIQVNLDLNNKILKNLKKKKKTDSTPERKRELNNPRTEKEGN
jgi:hypothetical protein